MLTDVCTQESLRPADATLDMRPAVEGRGSRCDEAECMLPIPSASPIPPECGWNATTGECWQFKQCEVLEKEPCDEAAGCEWVPALGSQAEPPEAGSTTRSLISQAQVATKCWTCFGALAKILEC